MGRFRFKFTNKVSSELEKIQFFQNEQNHNHKNDKRTSSKCNKIKRAVHCSLLTDTHRRKDKEIEGK